MPIYEDFVIDVVKVGSADIYAVGVRHVCANTQHTKNGTSEANGNFTLAEIMDLPLPSPAIPALTPMRKIVPFAGGPPKEFAVSLSETFPDATAAHAFGLKLSQAFFKSQISQLWGGAVNHCQTYEAVLRVRLDLTRAPELAALPWEYLRLVGDENYVALDENFTLVRYLQTTEPMRPLKINPPLRVLVLASTPLDLAELATHTEILKIRAALAELQQEFVSVSVLDNGTVEGLQQALEQAQAANEPFHIFHFIGHGAFEEEKQEGVLLFENEAGQSVAVGHEDLARLLQPYRSDLRVVLLNACEGARASNGSVFASVAAKVVQLAGIPAAIAMQYSITDTAAIAFAKAFYQEIAQSSPLEDAVDKARLAISNTKTGPEEWGTPVFYLRASSGQLLDLSTPRFLPTLTAHYEAVLDALPNSKLVFFLGLNVNTVGRPYYDLWEPRIGSPTTSELCSYLIRQLKLAQQDGSVAGLAQQLRMRQRNLRDEFRTIFKPTRRTSSLYQVLASLTLKVTQKLQAEGPDVCHNGLLFVTTTYDEAIETAFGVVGINEYHTLCYGQDDEENWLFIHRHYRDGKLQTATPLDAQNPPNTYLALNSKAPVILKLPGEVTGDSGFAVTEDDFFVISRKDLSELIPANILTQLRKSRHLYMGYDIQNWPLRLLWNRICEGQSKKAKGDSYAVVFDENTDPSAPFWRDSGVTLAQASLEDYVAGLELAVLQLLPE